MTIASEMNIFNNLHLIQKDNLYCAFHIEKFALIDLNEETFRILKDLKNGFSVSEIVEVSDVDKQELSNMVMFFSKLDQNCSNFTKSLNYSFHNINRITVHVANDCNLRCSYCYASGGSYKLRREMMSLKTAELFVDFCENNFNNVNNIVFFGGEPFLNCDVIEYICKEFKDRYFKGRIKYLPSFNAITNGTIISKRVFDIIKKYMSYITVSIDGPKIVNDVNRKNIFGEGTYEQIAKFISKCKSIEGLSISYEATFTKAHLALGYTHNKIKEFMEKCFDLKGVIVDDMFSLENLADNNTYSEKSVITGEKVYPEIFWNVLRTLVKKTPNVMCPLCREIFAVSTEGDIYPCHINTGDKHSSVGNIGSDNIFNNNTHFTQLQKGLARPFKDNENCRSCWARNICGGCSRLFFFNETLKEYAIYPKDSLCEINRTRIEKALLKILEVRKDKRLWGELVGKA